MHVSSQKAVCYHCLCHNVQAKCQNVHSTEGTCHWQAIAAKKNEQDKLQHLSRELNTT